MGTMKRSGWPNWMVRLLRHEATIWNVGIGLILALSLVRYLLGR